jgi:hypothetical protein
MHAFRTAVAVVTLMAAIGSTDDAWAWGDHKIVCKIAFHELTDKAHAEVIKLIKRGPRAQVLLGLVRLAGSPEAARHGALHQRASRLEVERTKPAGYGATIVRTGLACR